MLKRWAALPRGIRWLAGGIAAVMLALAIVWVLLVPAADWLARHDVGSAKGALHETALDNARGRLLTLGAGLFAAGALVFTALNFNLLQRTSRQTDQWQRRTYELAEQGQVTDRYTKAIEQLGSGKLDVQIGGIYALERIARDSAMDHPTVMEVLTAFVRDHSREPLPPPADDEPGAGARRRGTRSDVQAAVTVIGRRNARHDRQRLGLAGTFLAGTFLSGANLAGADLSGAYLTDAWLTGADLAGAWLTGAYLTDAYLAGANLSGANLSGADLSGAWLSGADLSGAFLGAADLSGAYLGGARWPRDAPVPEGWQRDTDSGRLKWIDTGSGGTATKLSSVSASHRSVTGEPVSHAVPPGAGDRAIVLLSNWAEGRYEDVAANFDAALTAKLPTGQLAAAWTQFVGTAGTYQRMGGEPFVRQLGDQTVVAVPMEFEASVMKGNVAFNAEGQVSGLYILNPDTSKH